MDHCMKPTPASPPQSVPSQSNTATAGWAESMRRKNSEEVRVEILRDTSSCSKSNDLVKKYRKSGRFSAALQPSTLMMQHRRELRQHCNQPVMLPCCSQAGKVDSTAKSSSSRSVCNR